MSRWWQYIEIPGYPSRFEAEVAEHDRSRGVVSDVRPGVDGVTVRMGSGRVVRYAEIVAEAAWIVVTDE